MDPRYRVSNEYFEWLASLVCDDQSSELTSYGKLLMLLHDIEFTYTMLMDENRASDGIDLRYRFMLYHRYPDYTLEFLDGPCSVLEMMVALAVRFEEEYMDDPCKGNRTGQWFWEMVVNLGLGDMTDNRFDPRKVKRHIYRFLERDYEPNGKGGLFTVRNCNEDLRTVEIWYQMCWYSNDIT